MTPVFVASVATFIVLNLIENLIHYSTGRSSEGHSYGFKIVPPTKEDWVKIVIIMTIFALLQGTITCYLTGC